LLACWALAESEVDCCRKEAKKEERKNGRWDGIFGLVLALLFLSIES